MAKEKLSMEEYAASMTDVYTTSVSEATLDEAPMAYKSLDDIIDVIKEEQAKLGFKEEKIHLYYPLSSLNHFFSVQDSAEEMLARLQNLPEELTSDRRLILQLLEKRRGKLKEKILAEHPEVLERLEQRRKKLEERLEKQNPEAVQKWKHWKEEHLKD